jgi:hypothetical protein
MQEKEARIAVPACQRCAQVSLLAEQLSDEVSNVTSLYTVAQVMRDLRFCSQGEMTHVLTCLVKCGNARKRRALHIAAAARWWGCCVCRTLRAWDQ